MPNRSHPRAAVIRNARRYDRADPAQVAAGLRGTYLAHGVVWEGAPQGVAGGGRDAVSSTGSDRVSRPPQQQQQKQKQLLPPTYARQPRRITQTLPRLY